jgi:hypothetical protein
LISRLNSTDRITVADARLRLNASMGDPAAIAEVRRREEHERELLQKRVAHRVRLRMIEIEGRTRIALMKREHAEKMAELRTKQAAVRRREETFVRDSVAIRWRWAREDARRDGKPVPLELAQRKHRIAVEQAQIIMPDDAPWVPVWRAHADELLRTHKIECRWEVAASGTNAYAWASLREIEVPPIISAGSYAVFLHETGHVLRPCEPSHVRVKSGSDTCCVRCELNAWVWATETARPFWMLAMHERMSASLGTYASYCTEPERVELAAFTSRMTYHRIRLQRATAA